MKLLLKQRLFSWFDKYDIFDECGNTVFTVEGKFSWGHKLHIMNSSGTHIATVKQALFTLLPRFEMYKHEEYIGSIQKKFSLFTPHYELDFNDWCVTGDFLEWDYSILDSSRHTVATVSKEIFNFTDVYTIETLNDTDALYALMVILSIDAEKCSRD